MNVEYTDAPTAKPALGDANNIPCPYCGHLLPRDATSCDHCDWTRSATEPAEGKASDAVAVLLSIIPGLGTIYKGHKLAGCLWIALQNALDQLHAFCCVHQKTNPPRMIDERKSEC